MPNYWLNSDSGFVTRDARHPQRFHHADRLARYSERVWLDESLRRTVAWDLATPPDIVTR